METHTVHLVARAVIEHERHFLVAQAKSASNTFLPGGHIEPGEGIPNCLKRELLEETGLNVTVGQFLGIVEADFVDEHGHRHIEINHLFLVSAPNLTRDQPVASLEPHLSFEWVSQAQFDARQLQPSPLRALLREFDLGAAWYASSLGSFKGAMLAGSRI